MQPSESPFLIFVRSMVLLATLIALPGIAICWNQLPKDFWKKPADPLETKNKEQTAFPEVITHEEFTAKDSPIAAFIQEEEQVPLNLPPASLPEIQNAIAIKRETPAVAEPQLPMNLSPTKEKRDYESMELRLKALGAKYYRLEKWGNRGELFRFSCFTAPSEKVSYEKYFQAIGTDEMSVMQSVINDIEKWKTTQEGQ